MAPKNACNPHSGRLVHQGTQCHLPGVEILTALPCTRLRPDTAVRAATPSNAPSFKPLQLPLPKPLTEHDGDLDGHCEHAKWEGRGALCGGPAAALLIVPPDSAQRVALARQAFRRPMAGPGGDCRRVRRRLVCKDEDTCTSECLTDALLGCKRGRLSRSPSRSCSARAGAELGACAAHTAGTGLCAAD